MIRNCVAGEDEKPCIGKRTQAVVPVVTDKYVHPDGICWSAQLVKNTNKSLQIQARCTGNIPRYNVWFFIACCRFNKWIEASLFITQFRLCPLKSP